MYERIRNWFTGEREEEKQKEREHPGLRKIIRPGEVFPWKGIWFEVESVNFDSLVLRPRTATHRVTMKVHNFKKRGIK